MKPSTRKVLTKRTSPHVRCALAASIAMALAACGSGSDSTPESVSSGSRMTSNSVLTADSQSVELKGRFEPIVGYLSGGQKVLLSKGSEAANATFHWAAPDRGFYEIFAWWPQQAPDGSSAQIVVKHQGGETKTIVDQEQAGGDWNSLGIFEFDPERPATVTLNKVGSSPLVVDTLRFHYVGDRRPDVAVETEALPLAEQDSQYAGQVRGWGGVAPYTYRVADGALPHGLELEHATGAIKGVPAGIGRHEFRIEISDSARNRVVKPLSIEVVETQDDPLAPGEVFGPRKKSAGQSESLAQILAALPEGEWAQVNLNSYSSVWAPPSLRNESGGTIAAPSKIILAWSSFAWDSKRGQLILYGGGHANYRGNDVYIWNGTTRMWQRASVSSESTRDPLGNRHAIDGHDKAPPSAHTYDNSEYLPIIDRFITLGGAADSNGGHFLIQDTATTSRRTGPYLFDPSRADPNKVGGTTGSHVKRVSPHPEIVGGEMWANREHWLNASPPPTHDFAKGCTAYAEEGGKDVLYARTQFGVYRVTFNSLIDSGLDTWEKVGRYWNGPSSQGPCGHDPVGKSFVRVATNKVPFVYWDLNKAAGTNNDVNVTPTDPTGEFGALLASNAIDLRYCGLDFDPERRVYMLWCGDGRTWALEPPATLSASGWTITKQRTPVLATPNGSVGTGILGKWKYIASLDAFMGLQDATHGNIWIYKPVGWQGTSPGTPGDPGPGDPGDPGDPPGDPGDPGDPDPGPTNKPPLVSISQPMHGSISLTGQPVTIAADATDSDGSVVKVEFFNGTNKIGEVTSAPFSVVWTSPPVGTHTLTAIASDNSGATAVSSPIDISVSVGGSSGTVVLQRGSSGYTSTSDTYLSSYHKSLSFGSNAIIQDSKSFYSILARFAIFQSEGGPVPNGAAIRSASLSFYKSSSYNMTYAVHRIMKDWNEAAANWNQTGASGAWSVAGANGAGSDYLATADATANAGFDPGWIEFDVTTSVQQMSLGNPVGNYGWRVLAVSGYTSALKKFHSSEYGGNIDLRPKLTISYE